MPIVNDDAEAPPIAAPNTVEIAAPEFKSVTVDTRYVPSSTLVTHVEGSSWTVNYFSQILATDSQAQGQQSSLDPIYQQYRLIKDFELKVSQPLTSSQDTETQSMDVTGGANVYPFLIPNTGDMFIADVGDGREGIFRVTRSERRSIFKDTCYAIEYILISFADPDRTGDLYSKVQDTLQFVKDFLMHGQNPILKLSDFEVVRALADRYGEIVRRYFRSVISNQHKTVLIPGQEYTTYDAFLMRAVAKYFSTWDADELRQLRQLNVDDDPSMKTPTLWDALTDRDPLHLREAAKHMGLVSTRLFSKNPMLEGIFWSGVERAVYPKDPGETVDFEQIGYLKPTLDGEALVEKKASDADLSALVSEVSVADLPFGSAPFIHPVLEDEYYIFSQAFYDKAAEGQSRLELAVHDYLAGNAPNHKLLLALSQTWWGWGTLERFYYTPILLVLIKASIRYL